MEGKRKAVVAENAYRRRYILAVNDCPETQRQPRSSMGQKRKGIYIKEWTCAEEWACTRRVVEKGSLAKDAASPPLYVGPLQGLNLSTQPTPRPPTCTARDPCSGQGVSTPESQRLQEASSVFVILRQHGFAPMYIFEFRTNASHSAMLTPVVPYRAIC
ncbi:hypothetical protein K491DRAFT_477115 [Lophiostoma macrostomum CBS 122681]|uniref:Uncharacterized protein n=1 Tax=Lophiostoma macrostomum CBS 122681 TaxID=1314788 RepID=A0A6A6TP57_9PLEO|nr:hypothetical protein K491DRAFT_477115 [Lophiostoma macrostomum CBS 122681]